MQGLFVDLKNDRPGAVVLAGVKIEVDFEESRRNLVRLRFTACDDGAKPVDAATPFREDIRLGVHYLTRRPTSVRMTG